MPARRNNTGNQAGKVPDRTTEALGLMPPQDLDAEAAVLGALMIEKEAHFMVGDILRPEHFYSEKNGHIYEAIMALIAANEPTDSIAVANQLKLSGHLQDIGGKKYLSQLTDNIASTVGLEKHANIVKDKFLARELIRICAEVQTKAYSEEVNVSDLLQEAEMRTFEVSQNNIRQNTVAIGDVVRYAIERIEEAGGKDLTGIPSGFTKLDNITNGWQPGTLNIIAARPAMGKTAFALSMAKNMAVDHQKRIAFFSLEMSTLELVNRLLSNVCEIAGENIKKGNLEPWQWEQMGSRSVELCRAQLYIDDTPNISISELSTKARRLKAERDIDCIMIDYLQMLNAAGMQYGSREQEVGLISRHLKGLAKELQIPVIALAQLNRGVEGRTGDDKRPQLSDLRESDSIEQDADIVLMIHRPEYYHITQDAAGNDLRGVAQIIIAKNRSGAVDDVNLIFKKEYVKFVNPSNTAADNEFGASWGAQSAPPLPATGQDAFVPPAANTDEPF